MKRPETKQIPMAHEGEWDDCLRQVEKCDMPEDAINSWVNIGERGKSGGGDLNQFPMNQYSLEQTIARFRDLLSNLFDPSTHQDILPQLSGDTSTYTDHLELLVSDNYELLMPLPIHVYTESDESVIIASLELNLYAEGKTEYEARHNFSQILIEQLEELESILLGDQKLGRDLQIQFSLLRRILKKSENA